MSDFKRQCTCNGFKQSLRIEHDSLGSSTSIKDLKTLENKDTVFILDNLFGSERNWPDIVDTLQLLASLVIPLDKDGIDVFTVCDYEHQTKQTLETQQDLGSLAEHFQRLDLMKTARNEELYATFSRRLMAYIGHWDSKQKITDGTSISCFPGSAVKGLNLIVLTNGAFLGVSKNSFPELKNTIENIAKNLNNRYAPFDQIGIQFVSIGGSKDTWERLQELDDCLVQGDRDMIDATQYCPETDRDNQQKHVKILTGGFIKTVDHTD
ncbi:hypothetical protein EDC01DRAFT_316101 [Geopyxis carbonaria]|nr:hypothetical protein EDC01DRAFT_316101 [Geopyxis carbonaria]